MPDADAQTESIEPVEPGIAASPRTFPCKGCGADLTFCPGEQSLKCEHCGAVNEIEAGPEVVEEQDYGEALASLERSSSTVERLEVRCEACGANVQFEDNVTSKVCCFCGTPIVAGAVSAKRLKPTPLPAVHSRIPPQIAPDWLMKAMSPGSGMVRMNVVSSPL